ncbi:VOC family protein [Marininema halotolerans]|uniref:VOC domain-containing protein n=1 Tax=Marininema halotolerans TaxID=1155944 RepID=A0A1I6PXE9_9BACL|nr:VOC family protein [Marininema halotolerans]SFS44869.1 hypothetical protein SAMN05444972_102201 [Marininema halotolerans]
MQLFHYHYWTENVEKMERFYKSIGFTVALRIGLVDGDPQTFNPPLSWEDFRDRGIHFRIIEMRKGQVNVTFGMGTRDRFDHIGFLVNDRDYSSLVQRAHELEWKVDESERRTFIQTPWRFRIELQQRREFVLEEEPRIDSCTLMLPVTEKIRDLATFLGVTPLDTKAGEIQMVSEDGWSLTIVNGPVTQLRSITFSSGAVSVADPVGVALHSI